MQDIGKFKQDINVIPNSLEKYLAFMLGKHLVFLDIFQLMSSGLDKLVANLPEDAFKYTSEELQRERLELMTKKGVYTYGYMNSFTRFEDISLPPKNEFKLKNMRGYHDLYLKSDVLFLSDVFENFRRTCKTYYKPGALHYFTTPGLAWDAMLKMTTIQLVTEIVMYMFIEKGMRGGVSCIANRYGKANHRR